MAEPRIRFDDGAAYERVMGRNRGDVPPRDLYPKFLHDSGPARRAA